MGIPFCAQESAANQDGVNAGERVPEEHGCRKGDKAANKASHHKRQKAERGRQGEFLHHGFLEKENYEAMQRVYEEGVGGEA